MPVYKFTYEFSACLKLGKGVQNLYLFFTGLFITFYRPCSVVKNRLSPNFLSPAANILYNCDLGKPRSFLSTLRIINSIS